LNHAPLVSAWWFANFCILRMAARGGALKSAASLAIALARRLLF